jgi:TRAP-type C4-dicarboxylate transport system permease small subunit
MLKSRIVHALYGALMTFLSMLMFACAGWTLANIEIDPNVVPIWLWNLNFTIMLLVGMLGTIYYCFRTLDELFLKADDSRRITGRRVIPAKRPVKTTWL